MSQSHSPIPLSYTAVDRRGVGRVGALIDSPAAVAERLFVQRFRSADIPRSVRATSRWRWEGRPGRAHLVGPAMMLSGDNWTAITEIPGDMYPIAHLPEDKERYRDRLPATLCGAPIGRRDTVQGERIYRPRIVTKALWDALPSPQRRCQRCRRILALIEADRGSR